MLLKMETLVLLEPDGEEKFKAKPGLTEAQKARLLAIDAGYFKLNDEHLITNYEDLK